MLRIYEIFAACTILIPSLWFIGNLKDSAIQFDLLVSIVAGAVCCLVTAWLIPTAASYLLRRGLKGTDLGKKGTEAGRVDMYVSGVCSIATWINITHKQYLAAPRHSVLCVELCLCLLL